MGSLKFKSTVCCIDWHQWKMQPLLEVELRHDPGNEVVIVGWCYLVKLMEDLREQWPEPGCWPALFVKTMVCRGCSVSRAQKTWLWSLLFMIFRNSCGDLGCVQNCVPSSVGAIKGTVARYCACTAMIDSGSWLTNRNRQKRRPATMRILRDFEVCRIFTYVWKQIMSGLWPFV